MTIDDALKFGARSLANAGLAEPQREANSLLQFAIARDRAFTVAHPEYELSDSEAKLFQTSIVRRAAREPFQHIAGKQEFYGLDFLVTPDVLIPRHETELIVERAIEMLAEHKAPRFLEIGVGSGCISVAILTHSPGATALAVDISEPAINIARQNAEMHNVSGRLAVIASDVFENVPDELFDLIVSNPPYVPIAEYAGLQPEVRDHDPRIAVTDGSTGLTIIEQIVAGSPTSLKPGGHLLMEIGFSQGHAVRSMFDEASWASTDVLPDLQGIPRTVVARRQT